MRPSRQIRETMFRIVPAAEVRPGYLVRKFAKIKAEMKKAEKLPSKVSSLSARKH